MALSSEKSISTVKLILNEFLRDISLFEYLKKSSINNDKPILSAIFVKLTNLNERNLVDILPNIIYIFRNYKNKDVEKFLFKLCEKSPTVYLIVRWAYRAYNQQDCDQDEYESSLNNMDSSVMNKQRLDQNNINQAELQQKIQQFVERKAHQSIKIFLTNQFYNQLTKLTMKLKSYLPDERQNNLRLFLQKYYERFLNQIHQKAQTCLPGMYFPIPSDSNFVVGIDYQYCFPFSTKQRVPYKIVFQTVNHEELVQSEKQKQELARSVFKMTNTKSIQCDTQSTKENEDNNQQIQKQTAAKMKQYMKKYGDLSDEKIDNSFLKSTRKYFSNEWKKSVQKIVDNSAYKGLKSHRVRAYMVKGGDDMRQEFFAMQLIKQMAKIWKDEKLKIWVKTYDVIIFTKNSGFIEFIPDTITISKLKQQGGGGSLRSCYKHLFGSKLDHAIKNFVVSLAGYSIIQYVFQIKDRHNGNIMIDSQGHIIHIDFGFLLGTSPGNMNFQKAPFKLTSDYIQLMQGLQSQYYLFFKQLLFMGFSLLKGYIHQIINLIQVMKQKSDLDCFTYYNQKELRFRMMQNCTDQQIRKKIQTLLYNSGYSHYTRHYDRFQWYTNGIYK